MSIKQLKIGHDTALDHINHCEVNGTMTTEEAIENRETVKHGYKDFATKWAKGETE